MIALGQNIPEKYQHAKISYDQSQDLNILANLGLPIEHGTHKPGRFIISDFSQRELELARNAGFQVEVLIEDSTEHFLQQNRNSTATRNASCNEGEEYETPANFNLGSMGGYFTYQEMLNELDDMAALYPDLITVRTSIKDVSGVPFVTEGEPDDSVSPSIGGNEIQWVKISDNPEQEEDEEQILYSAIHHAREPMSMSQLIFYMWYLLENYEDDSEVQGIVNNTELYFIPVLNPDGYLYNEATNPEGGGFWRKNRRNNGNGTFGVDNNRNYNYHINGDSNNGSWGGDGASPNPDSSTYHGTEPFSEVENQAMKSFVEQHQFVMAFNNHSFSELLLRPFGYAEQQPTPEEDLFEALGAELVSKNGYNNIISSELYAAAGVSDDFFYGTVGTHDKVYAYTPEIGPAFWPPSSSIESIAKEMMYLNLTSSKMVNNYAQVTEVSPSLVDATGVQNAEFNIKRLGIKGDGNFNVTLVPVSSNITAAGEGVSFTGMDIFSEDVGVIPYTISDSGVSGDTVVFDLIVDNGQFVTPIRITKTLGNTEVVFQDDASSLDAYTNNGFELTASDFVSGPSSITESANGDYDANSDKSITIAETIDLTDAIGGQVSFFTKFDIEAGWDYAQFQISTDGGASWISQCGRYTSIGGGNFQPVGEPLYDGNLSDWSLEEISLSDYAGEEIMARFIFRSDGVIQEDGFYFDDFMVTLITSDPLSTEEFTQEFKVYPNPVKDILRISTMLSNYSASIYNLQGQKISEIADRSGVSEIDYSDLATGIYLMVLKSGDTLQTIKLIKQ